MAEERKSQTLKRAGVEEKKIFKSLAKLQKYPRVREIFKEAARLFRSGKLKNIKQISKNRNLNKMLADLPREDRKMYKKHLEKIGFPSVEETITKIQKTRTAIRLAGEKKDKIKQVKDRFSDQIEEMTEKKNPILKTLNKHIKYLGEESFFQKAHLAAKQRSIIERSETSIDFYREYAIEYGTSFNFRDMIREGGKRKSNFLLGRMYFYKYKPDPIETQFDLYPLIFILKKSSDHFEGINFHYMSPKARAMLIQNIFLYLNKVDYTANQKILFNSFIKIIRKLIKRNLIYINFSPNKKYLLQNFPSEIRRSKNIVFTYKKKISEIVDIIYSCNIVIGNETGPVCLGAALQKKIHAIYTPLHTLPESKIINKKNSYYNTYRYKPEVIIKKILNSI